MKICTISGWREWHKHCDPGFVITHLRQMTMRGFDHFRVGGAAGVDKIAYDWLYENQWSRHEYKADWATYGNKAGPIRNRDMLEGSEEGGILSDMLLAFPEPGFIRANSGTWDCIKKAHELHIPFYVPGYRQERK